jgi:hypothetical protein
MIPLEALEDELNGVWRLLSARREDAGTGEFEDVYGPDPLGYLLLAPAGRMMALLSARERSGNDPGALFGSMMAYSGTYRIDGERWITDVDVAWFPDWLGTKQERFFSVKGDDLLVRTAPVEHPSDPGRKVTVVLRWRREERLAHARGPLFGFRRRSK